MERLHVSSRLQSPASPFIRTPPPSSFSPSDLHRVVPFIWFALELGSLGRGLERESQMDREISTRFLVSSSISVTVAAEEGRRDVSKLPTAASFLAGALPFCAINSGVSTSQIGYSPAPTPDQLGFGFFADDLAASPQCHSVECLACMDPRLKLKNPKIEQPENGKQALISPEVGFHGFHGLPGLRSLEPIPEPAEKSPISPRLPGDLISIIQSSQKRFRPSSPPSTYPPPPPLPPSLRSPSTYYDFQGQGATGRNLRRAVPSSELARQRRKRISDRTRILETLMPWERRMDTGTMLQEAHKYVRFLEAQVTALQTMPCSSSFAPVHLPSDRFGGLELLNRQQLLQVMVNSPVVQDVLYRKGLCVFSAEQVPVLRQEVERRPQAMRLLGSTVAK